MGFNKEPEGILLLALCHILFLGQIVFVAYIDDEFTKYDKYKKIVKYQNPYLLYNQFIFYLFVLLAFISHLRTAITNPGTIHIKNNMDVIQFYYNIHEPLIQKAILVTQKQTQEAIRKIIFEANHIKFDENANYDLDNDDDFINNSDTDEKKFEKKTSISEAYKKAMIRNYRLKLTRCKNCYVVRPSNVHHCSVCHSCILEQDHHCPWVNNCVGLFNKKFFILYNFYALLSVIYSFIIFGYYALYKHLNIFYENYAYIICSIVFIIIEIIYGSFACVLLVEQYNNIKHDCNIIDYNNGILLERSTFKQQLLIIFGNKMSLKWLLPFYSGGNYDYYVKLCKYINKEKEKDDNEQKIDKYGNKKDKLD